MQKEQKITRKRRGVSFIEYGILATLITIAGIITIQQLGKNSNTLYCEISDSIGTPIGLGTANCATGGVASKLYGVGYTGTLGASGGVSCKNICSASNITSIDAETLAKLNSIDPITSFYGLTDPSTGKNATSINEAYALTNLYGRGVGGITDPNGNSYHYEVQTSSGKTYGFFTSNNSMSYRDLATGETYYINPNNGNIINEGVTTGNIDYKNLFSA